MFGITRIAIATAAIATAGTGSVLACNMPPPSHVDTAAQLSAKASADLSAAVDAHQRAAEAIASTDAGVKAQAETLLETSVTKLDDASVNMKAAVDAGSKTAVDGIASFTAQTTKLVNSLATTAGATLSTSAQTGVRLVDAVNTQLATARAVGGATGEAAVKALTSVTLPQLSVPQTSVSSQVSANVQSDSTVSLPSVNLSGLLGGQAGVSVGR